VTENNIKVILAACWAMFYVCVATEIASISVSVAKLLVFPVWGSFYLRFVHDGLLHSRTVSTQVEVDRAYPKTVVAAEITFKCLHIA